jgi:hypothetical protein
MNGITKLDENLSVYILLSQLNVLYPGLRLVYISIKIIVFFQNYLKNNIISATYHSHCRTLLIRARHHGDTFFNMFWIRESLPSIIPCKNLNWSFKDSIQETSYIKKMY